MVESAQAAVELPEDVQALLNGANPCFVTTLMPDGSPQTTQTWVETDGTDVIINTVAGFQKARNIARDPRVSIAVADATRPYRYVAVRGRVSATTEQGGAEHIEALAQRYLGGPYPWYGGRDQTRVIVRITPTSLHQIG